MLSVIWGGSVGVAWKSWLAVWVCVCIVVLSIKKHLCWGWGEGRYSTEKTLWVCVCVLGIEFFVCTSLSNTPPSFLSNTPPSFLCVCEPTTSKHTNLLECPGLISYMSAFSTDAEGWFNLQLCCWDVFLLLVLYWCRWCVCMCVWSRLMLEPGFMIMSSDQGLHVPPWGSEEDGSSSGNPQR